MARLPRYVLPGQPQHVIQRGNNRARMFMATADFLFFRECLGVACARHDCRIHAYVLMTNHVHLLITPSTEVGIAKVMQMVGCSYVLHFNRANRRTGTLWEGRYRATPVQTDRYLLTCYRYIELNPVRAGLVACPQDYPWSSHNANAFGRPDPLISSHELYRALGGDAPGRQAAYRALFQDAVDPATLREIREATNKAWALGSEGFCDEIRALTGRRSKRLEKGRPPWSPKG